MTDDAYNRLYDAVTAQLEEERDGAGGEGDDATAEAVERIWEAVRSVNSEVHA